MTEERRLELEEKLNIAEAHGNQAEIEAVKKTMDQEYRLCTSHTATRLKRVEQTVNQIKAGLIPTTMFTDLKTGLEKVSQTVVELKTEVEGWKNQVHGAKVLWKFLRYIVAMGGGAALMKLLGNLPVG